MKKSFIISGPGRSAGLGTGFIKIIINITALLR